MNTRIEKEFISVFKFNKGEVLSGPVQKIHRYKILSWALSLGNTEKHKVRITFRPELETFETETTIWALTDKHVVLKSGVIIPIERIVKVEFI
ncbi:MAG: hypothetical protein MRY83_22130 [Flavobacteriales bacterium]|nr:hypothetical protein [Flavobacteriales bacterium]